jgi:hypothetical protein
VPAATDESGLISVANFVTCGPGAADEAGQQVQYVMQNNSNTDLFAAAPVIDASGGLSFTPKHNVSGSAVIEFRAVDNGGTASGGVDKAVLSFTIGITEPHPLYNAAKPNDVSGDDHIVAGDALDVINYINAFKAGPIPAVTTGMKYLDTNHDNNISASDALEVINFINAFGADGLGRGEGEAATAAAGSAATISDELLTLLGADLDALPKRKR